MASGGAESKVSIQLKWRKGKKAPCEMSNRFIGETAAAVDGNFVYILSSTTIYSYNASRRSWSLLAFCTCESRALAVVNNLVTLIGGRSSSSLLSRASDKLVSLTKKDLWTEEFPPMPTKRYGVCALCTETALIVAGGEGDVGLGRVATTEVLNTATLQWSTAVDLPQPTYGGSLLQVSNDQIHVVGAYDKDNSPIKSVYTCTLSALLQTCNPQSFGAHLASSLSPSEVWRRETDIPVVRSSYVSLQGRLLAIGGKDSTYKRTSAVHMYDPSSNSWEVISHMATPRSGCYAAVVSDNQLIVVGGYIDDDGTTTDTVEIARTL